MELEKTLRWFGENDAVSLSDIRQAGASGVVTALHHIPNGEVWSVEEILKTKNEIEKHGLTWNVVESLPVTEEIKKASELRDQHIQNYKESVRNLGKCGISTICYNFMPVLDWARTDLHFKLENGAEAMLFDPKLFAAFDLFILKRPNATEDYTQKQIDEARELYESLSADEIERLGYNIVVKTQSFIDGAVKEGERNYLDVFNRFLSEYDNIDKDQLRENFKYFLEEVIPVAEESGVNLAVHPDDPPFSLLGLPRIVSSLEDFEWLSTTVPSVNNGITLCAGSLSASTTNDVPAIFEKYAERVHFLHLRSTTIKSNGDFFEDDHLDGGVDMASLMKAIVVEQNRRDGEGRTDVNIPMRPDHGHKILDDFKRDANPGYPLIGRLKGLAELKGLEMGIRYMIDMKN